MNGAVCPNCVMRCEVGKGKLLTFRHICPDGTRVIHGPDKDLAVFLDVPEDSVLMIRKETVPA